jgi:hypothetical protein
MVALPLAELIAIVREYIDESRFDAADRLLNHCLAAHPRHPETLHLKGFIAFKRGRIEDAAGLMEQALAAGATQPRQLCNMAEVYRMLGRLDEGVALTRRAQALAPSDAVTHFNEAMLRYERLEPDECIRACRRAVQLKPDMPEAHMRLGQTLLLTGAFAEGWEEYEWRYRIPGAQPLMPKIERPQWDGSPLPADQRLLLVADQGFGDVIMFARYLPWVIKRAPNATVASSVELCDLLARHFPGPTYVARWDMVPPHVAYVPFSGLPRLRQTRIDSIPQPGPYMRPLPEKLAAWRDRLASLLPDGRKRVALAWAGRPTHNNDRSRSMTLDQLAPLGQVPGFAFVAVQKGPPVAQVGGWRGPAPLISLDAQIESFDDTLAILHNVDLLISVDTSLGHLAGAAGRPAWIMMPWAPDFRWLLGRSDSPWYPSLRLFRQQQVRDWPSVVEPIARELAALAAG